MSATSTASGLVMVIVGVWVLLQTLVGGLASRLLALGKTGSPSAGSPSPFAAAGGAAGAAKAATGPAAPPLGLGGAHGKPSKPSSLFPYIG